MIHILPDIVVHNVYYWHLNITYGYADVTKCYCICMQLNKTGVLFYPDANQVLQFFTAADWTGQDHEGMLPALVQSSPGIFTAQGRGLYLIYINVS